MVKMIKAKKGKVEVVCTDANIELALARDDGRIYSRPGAGWVDLTPDAAQEVVDALTDAITDGLARGGVE